jgi:hypothetical protein
LQFLFINSKAILGERLNHVSQQQNTGWHLLKSGDFSSNFVLLISSGTQYVLVDNYPFLAVLTY